MAIASVVNRRQPGDDKNDDSFTILSLFDLVAASTSLEKQARSSSIEALQPSNLSFVRSSKGRLRDDRPLFASGLERSSYSRLLAQGSADEKDSLTVCSSGWVRHQPIWCDSSSDQAEESEPQTLTPGYKDAAGWRKDVRWS